MLKSKYDDVLDPFDWVRGRIPGETLADENLDASQVVAGTPVILEEQLATERRKFQLLKLTLLRHLW